MVDPGKRAFEHVRVLAEEIGCRMIATPAYHAAAEYISRTLSTYGRLVTAQSLDFDCWEPGYSRLVMNSRTLDCVINAFSPPCCLKASVLPISTPAELENADFSGGRIPLLYGHLTREPLTTSDAFYASEADHRVRQVLEEKRPAAVITVHPQRHGRWPLIEDPGFSIPSITVPSDTGLHILNDPAQPLELEINSRRKPGKAVNLVSGFSEQTSSRIVLSAHFDSKVNTPAAMDNAAGVAALLTLAEMWSGDPVARAVEMVFFGGEEYSMAVDQAYINQFPNPSQVIRAALNLDGIGHILKTTTVATFAVPENWEAAASNALASLPGVMRTDPWPQSDHSWFFPHGIPTWAVSQQGLFSLDFAHTLDDSLNWISPQKLEEAITFTNSLIRAIH